MMSPRQMDTKFFCPACEPLCGCNVRGWVPTNPALEAARTWREVHHLPQLHIFLQVVAQGLTAWTRAICKCISNLQVQWHAYETLPLPSTSPFLSYNLGWRKTGPTDK